MAPKHNRSYCCCCIPFRLAVALFSILALALGGASLWAVLRAGLTDSKSKIAAYIATGVYGVLGISGLVAVCFKRYALAKNFSVLWWIVTILTTILSVVSIILFATNEKDEVKAICKTDFLNDATKNLGGFYSPAALDADVDSCYKHVMIAAGVSTAVQVLVMMVGGWVASRYTSEAKHMRLGVTYTFGKGYGPVQPLVEPQGQAPPFQPAHPYTHIGGKSEWH
ncbi:hypothetical protein BGZ99_004023 [Dissophora globulifera]|uniref:Uncharacterized protein n=1 Tax=Dissophora globulifera TaxID=979702 RepID=A0A9P6RLL7_9FUNG|nr:hypothetical protein BGZ99_004023 [Dissophora globulifera]